MILVIDNYDSFVYNLAQYLGELGLLLAGIAFAAIDELLQNWVPRRAPQMADWLADVVGLVTGYVLYVGRWRHRWKTEARRARRA